MQIIVVSAILGTHMMNVIQLQNVFIKMLQTIHNQNASKNTDAIYSKYAKYQRFNSNSDTLL